MPYIPFTLTDDMQSGLVRHLGAAEFKVQMVGAVNTDTCRDVAASAEIRPSLIRRILGQNEPVVWCLCGTIVNH